MIQEALRKKLLAYEPLFNLVGERIYILKLPQNPVLPAVTYFRVSSPMHHDINISFTRFQFDSWALSYAEVRSVATEIRKAIQREKGIWDGVRVMQGVYINETEMYEAETLIYHIASDFKIIYKEE